MSQQSANALQVLEERGFIKQCTDLEGLGKLLTSAVVSYYCGFDPTGPSLHIGHLVPVFAMAHLAKAGHKPIALVGGGTARIGDPSGKSEMRKMLSYDTIMANAALLGGQLRAFLERAGVVQGVTMVNNADWLANLNYIDFLRDVGAHFSVNRMLSFETYKMRMETGLSFIEFNYQLLQSYDFHILNRDYGCRLQIGGDDQWGNIVSGADLIRRLGAENGKPNATAEAYGLTFPLVTRSDGKKMGKTEKGSLFLDPQMTPPLDIFQYWRNIPDADVGKFLRIFTFLPMDEVRRLESLKDAAINEAKERLAWEFTALVHGQAVADECLAAAKAAFGGSAAGLDSAPTLALDPAEIAAGVGLLDLLVRSGLAPSKGEARRLVQQGGISLGNSKAEDINLVVNQAVWQANAEADGSLLLRAGKKRFHRLTK
jgi:tyrosyl-tRNA synthetase